MQRFALALLLLAAAAAAVAVASRAFAGLKRDQDDHAATTGSFQKLAFFLLLALMIYVASFGYS